MGIDWVKFKIRSGADIEKIRESVTFLNNYWPHGRFTTRPNHELSQAEQEKWNSTLEKLKKNFVFPCVNYDDLPDPIPIDDISSYRVYVISYNNIFPPEWRDEAYRIILPEELLSYLNKWKQFIQQVEAGEWQQYLYSLYLYTYISDEHQYQEFEGLYLNAERSLKIQNAWAQKERLFPVREDILNFKAYKRLEKIREAVFRPEFDKAVSNASILPEQLEIYAKYRELRDYTCTQIRNWNRYVPRNSKIQYPQKMSFEEFLSLTESSWLTEFFLWCEKLIQEDYGLFLDY